MNAGAEPIRSAALPTPHGFFTRLGGVSTGAFASLNCGLSTGDLREAVLENRARAARAIGTEPQRLVGLMQVHGPSVVRVTEPWLPGAGPKADAMVTDRPGVALGIITADCAPILFADAAAGVVGAAHAGWRGAVAGVIAATVTAMVELGARPARIAAALGPCIRQQSYEVATDMRDAVLAPDETHGRFFATGKREARWQFDLAAFCAAHLAAAGIATIDIVDADTAADETRFFSFRRRTLQGGLPTGHQISIITI